MAVWATGTSGDGDDTATRRTRRGSRTHDCLIRRADARIYNGFGRPSLQAGVELPLPMKDLPLSKVYQLLEPGPVVLLTTSQKGHANVMTMSWHMMVEFEPPLVACVVSSANYSFAALRATKECVIAVPALKLAPKVVKVGNCSGRDVRKFDHHV